MKNTDTRRIILEPGSVKSVSDGQIHWVGVPQLLELYRIPKGTRFIVRNELLNLPRGFIPQEDDIRLYPLQNGQYAERAIFLNLKQRFE